MSHWYTGNIVGSHPHGGDDPCCSGYKENNAEPEYCFYCINEIGADDPFETILDEKDKLQVVCLKCFEKYE